MCLLHSIDTDSRAQHQVSLTFWFEDMTQCRLKSNPIVQNTKTVNSNTKKSNSSPLRNKPHDLRCLAPKVKDLNRLLTKVLKVFKYE